MILAQTLLVLPIDRRADRGGGAGGAGRRCSTRRARYGASALGGRARSPLREARVGVLAALIAALGTAMASVGAVLVVGSLVGRARRSPTAALHRLERAAASNAQAVAYGTVLLGLFLIVAAALTVVQQDGARDGCPVRS